MIDSLLELLNFVGPTLAALLTVPIMNGLKAISGWVDGSPPALKQILVVVIAFALTKFGTLINQALPTDLALFTGESVEALVSAGIAFAVHAGVKARSKEITILLLAIAMFATPASAQIASDSVEVDIYAPGDIFVTIAPRSYTGLVGDTLTFTAVAIDQVTGDTVPALINWSTPTPASISIDPMTGHATFLSRGKWRIRVDVERVGGLVLYELSQSGTFVVPVARDAMGVFQFSDFTSLNQVRQICAYLTNPSGVPIARHADYCPLPLISPSWAPTIPGLFRGA